MEPRLSASPAYALALLHQLPGPTLPGPGLAEAAAAAVLASSRQHSASSRRLWKA